MLSLSYYCSRLLFNKIGEKGKTGSAWKQGRWGEREGGNRGEKWPIHMCIQWLGHLSPFPAPSLSIRILNNRNPSCNALCYKLHTHKLPISHTHTHTHTHTHFSYFIIGLPCAMLPATYLHPLHTHSSLTLQICWVCVCHHYFIYWKTEA
jgi:hypothetical protein